MEDEQILELLEQGYQNGKTYEELTELGLDDYTMSVAKDFYSKKKETTEGSPVAGPLVYESESESTTTESPYSDPFAESDAILGGLLDPIEKAYESGKSLDDLKDVSPQVYALAQDYYRMTDAQNAQTLVAWYQDHFERDGITGTPSFFINGEKKPNMNYEDFSAALDEALAEAE